jgi:hypothetical protein
LTLHDIVSSFFEISHQSIILSADKVWGYGIGLLLYGEKLNSLSIFGSSEVFLSILILALYNQHEIKDNETKKVLEKKNSKSLNLELLISQDITTSVHDA